MRVAVVVRVMGGEAAEEGVENEEDGCGEQKGCGS